MDWTRGIRGRRAAKQRGVSGEPWPLLSTVARIELRDGALVLGSDIGHRELNILESGFGVGVSHHLLEDGQTDAGASHIGTEGVAEAVRICRGEGRHSAAMAKEAMRSLMFFMDERVLALGCHKHCGDAALKRQRINGCLRSTCVRLTAILV